LEPTSRRSQKSVRPLDVGSKLRPALRGLKEDMDQAEGQDVDQAVGKDVDQTVEEDMDQAAGQDVDQAVGKDVD